MSYAAPPPNAYGTIVYGQSTSSTPAAPPPQKKPPPKKASSPPANNPYHNNNNNNISSVSSPASSKDPFATGGNSGQGLGNDGSEETKFENKPVYNDVIFAVLFVVHLLAVFYLAFVAASKDNVEDDGTSNGTSSDSSEESSLSKEEIKDIRNAFFISGVVALTVAILWLEFMKKFAKQLIWFCLILYVVTAFITFVVFVIKGVYFAAIWAGLMLLMALLFFYFARKRIPFATVVLQKCVDLVKKYPALSFWALIMLVTQSVWGAFWAFAVSQMYNFPTSTTYFMGAFFLLSYFWTLQVIKNVLHTTVAGVVAAWYFLYQAGSAAPSPESPTLPALKRACTYSFGSICFGSLFIAVIQTVRVLVRRALKQYLKELGEVGKFLVCCIDCMIGCIENLAERFNKFAFTQVAIYGKPYMVAAKDTWDLAKRRGGVPLISDRLIELVLSFGMFVCGCVTTLITYFLVQDNLGPSQLPGVLATAFALGYGAAVVVSEVISSAVAGLMVCFLEEPDILQNNQPDLYALFAEKLGKA